ncbi:thioredoxin family protein [Niastella caeni]|nr:thioredoxin domain-containing protein [Niastella caeni]
MNKEVTQQDFTKHVIESRTLAIVQFKKSWLGTCQIIEPVYMDLARMFKDIASFYTVDVEKETTLEKEYGVMELPTILFFKGGQVIDHAIGLTPKNVLISKIKNAISSTNQ